MREKEGGYHAVIPEGWRQGRTAYGGLTAGLAYRAAQNSFENLPPLRSAAINFIGPVSGDVLFTASALRRGRNVTTIKVVGTLCGGEKDGAIIADIVFVFGINRESELKVDVRAAPCPAPKDCAPFTPEAAHRFVPGFFHRFETQLIDGARPMAGASEGYIRAWSRHADPASREGMGALLTLSDVLPPAAMPLFTKMGAVSSVNFLLNFVVDDPSTKDGWWQVDSRLTAARGGYSSQVMHIYNASGELIAQGLQSVAIFI
jgi:acyl-CoA thioesterase